MAAAHAVYVKTVGQEFGEEGLEALADANRLHGLELGMQGVKDGGLRKGDLKSIYEFFAAVYPFFGFELELEDISEN